ncbi:MAG: nadC, partial [Caulobacter sp.]|nr:nadC [Caulobacter sp.]
MIAPLPDLLIEPIVRASLAEDLGRAGDITALACIDADARLNASFGARKAGTIAGLACARLAILALDPTASFEVVARDGEAVEPGAILASVEANARALLSAERTALNLLGRLSGIATLTSAYVDAVVGTGASITDTRKTTPGLRALEKYAVRCGGGVNHRSSLVDLTMVKDNHVLAAGGVVAAFEAVRDAHPDIPVEVEVTDLDQLREVLDAGCERILLDNMTDDQMAEAVQITDGHATLEASGGLTLDRARDVAETGVDYISVGALTHS